MYVKILGLKTAHLQDHTFETIAHPIAKLRTVYQDAGADELCIKLWNSFNICVSR